MSREPPRCGGRRGHGWQFAAGVMVLFAVALGLRLVHVGQLRESPFATVKLGDGRAYDAWAREIAGGDWVGDEVFYQAPLYPYFLGALYATIGDEPARVLAVQAVLGAAACVLAALAVRHFFSRHLGVLTGLLLAGYGPLIFYESLFQKSALAVFCLSLVMWPVSRFVQSRGGGNLFAAGIALGLLILTRENALILLPALLAWLILVGDEPRSRRVRHGLLLFAGTLVCLLPVAARNFAVSGEFHLTSSQLGPNLYIGNHPGASGRYEPLVAGRGDARYERVDAALLAERALGRELTAGEVSEYWRRRAIRFVWQHPVEAVSLLARKAGLAFDADEIPDTEDLDSHADWSPPLAMTTSVLHFGVLFPLALVGVARTWPERRVHAPLLMMATAYFVGLVLFYVEGRYRLLLVPMLAPYAAAGLVAVIGVLGNWEWSGSIAVTLALAAVAAVVINFSPADSRAARAMTCSNLGVELVETGHPAEGIRWLRRSVALQPRQPVWHLQLGQAQLRTGHLDAATTSFEKAVELNGESPRGQMLFGLTLAAGRRFEAGAIAVGTALALDPGDAAKHYHLSLLLAALGRDREARQFARQAAELDAAYAEAELSKIESALARSAGDGESTDRRLEGAFRNIFLMRAERLEAAGSEADAHLLRALANAR